MSKLWYFFCGHLSADIVKKYIMEQDLVTYLDARQLLPVLVAMAILLGLTCKSGSVLSVILKMQ